MNEFTDDFNHIFQLGTLHAPFLHLLADTSEIECGISKLGGNVGGEGLLNCGTSSGGGGPSGGGGAGSISSEAPWPGVSSELCINSGELTRDSTQFCLYEGKTNVGSSSDKYSTPNTVTQTPRGKKNHC
jgi:hypothetical protein